MTEQEWLAATTVMNLELGRLPTGWHRKRRLFGCACARRVLHLSSGGGLDEALALSERLADGEPVRAELGKVRKALIKAHAKAEERERVYDEGGYQAAVLWTVLEATRENSKQVMSAGDGVLSVLEAALPPREWGLAGYHAEMRAQVALARDVFGNPFRPVAFAPKWRTSTAVALAETMYESRAFDRLPILADALEEAGCEQPDLLAHLRDPDLAHVRGCWAVDLVLGKS